MTEYEDVTSNGQKLQFKHKKFSRLCATKEGALRKILIYVNYYSYKY